MISGIHIQGMPLIICYKHIENTLILYEPQIRNL